MEGICNLGIIKKQANIQIKSIQNRRIERTFSTGFSSGIMMSGGMGGGGRWCSMYEYTSGDCTPILRLGGTMIGGGTGGGEKLVG